MMKIFALAILLVCSTSFADRVESLDQDELPASSTQKGPDVLASCIQKVANQGTPMKLEPWQDDNPVIKKLQACTGNPALYANDLLKDKIIASVPGANSKTKTAGLCYGRNPDFSPTKGGTGGKYRLMIGHATKESCLGAGGLIWF